MHILSRQELLIKIYHVISSNNLHIIYSRENEGRRRRRGRAYREAGNTKAPYSLYTIPSLCVDSNIIRTEGKNSMRIKKTGKKGRRRRSQNHTRGKFTDDAAAAATTKRSVAIRPIKKSPPLSLY